MREANAALRRAVVTRLRQARTPRERVVAVVLGNFEEEFFKPSISHAWLSLCAEVPREPQLARLQKVFHARMRSNLLAALRDIVEPQEAEDLARGISALIDRLWLRMGLVSQSVTREDALTQMQRYIERHLPAE